MSYLLDTNVICEVVKPKPNQHVLSWFDTIPDESLYLSVLTLGEIRKGIEKITDKHRKEKLRVWLEYDLPAWFEDRIKVIDHQVADRWGRLNSQIKRTLPAIDSLIAATALQFDLTLVTRNVQDFHSMTLQIVNPWD
ncbi:MAG: type II toxin-antitoxin system VapC family toxin [Gammaproteobacteria bacterium]